MKKILILYTSVGLGHKSIAENIAWHLDKAGYEVKLADVLQVQQGALVNFGTTLHGFVNTRLPLLWRWLYLYGHYIFLPFRVFTAGRNFQATKQIIDEFNPDLVITTQTSASAILEFLKRKKFYTKLWAVAFSDYHLHRYWLYPSVDFYLVNIPEQKQAMVKLHISADRIVICGMTLKSKANINLDEVRQKLGLEKTDKVVLIGSGSLGTGLSEQWLGELVLELNKLNKQNRVIIVCGKNLKFYEHLKIELSGTPAIVLGFYTPMIELYAISSLFLTKPGGLTVAESLQWHLPMLITHWLPGQEEINYHYLTEKHLIMPKPESMEPKALAKFIDRQLASGEFKNSLAVNPNVPELTQGGQEGQAVIRAIGSMFHNV